MGFVRKHTGIDLTGKGSLLGKTLDTIGDVVEKVGDTIEAIASDPKKLAMVGLAIAFPGAAATIGQSFGLSGAAATIAGQTVINTAINGGDVEQAVKGALVTYVGAEVAGQVGEAAKTSGASEAIAKTVGQSAGQAVTAAAMGKDPILALVAGGVNVASGLITQEIPGFSALPEVAQNAVRNAIAADMQGKDAIGAAASTLVNNAMGYAKNYAKVQADLAAKGLAALDTNALAAIKDADATDLTNVVKAAQTAQTYGTNLDADDISAIAGLKDSSDLDTYVTDNIVNPAQAERAGFGTDVNAWKEAQELGFTTAKDFNQYEDFAEMYKDVFGEEGTPEEVKKYLPREVKLQDTLDALKIHLGKKEATADDIDRLDFDRDGVIDQDDVLNLQKYYLKKPTAVDPSDYWTKNATPEAALENMRAAYATANPEQVEPTPDTGSLGDASDLPGMQDTGGNQLTDQDLADIVAGGVGDATLTGGTGTDTIVGGTDTGTTLTGDDGSTITINPDGTITSTESTLTGGSGVTDVITGGGTTQPNVEHYADGTYKVTYEDGTSAIFNADGSPYSSTDDTGQTTVTDTTGTTDGGTAGGGGTSGGIAGGGGAAGGGGGAAGGGGGTAPTKPAAPTTPSTPAVQPAEKTDNSSNLLALLALADRPVQQQPQPVPLADIKYYYDFNDDIGSNIFAGDMVPQKQQNTQGPAKFSFFDGGEVNDLSVEDLIRMLKGD
jgi:hypothetical protein